jgi:CBS domain containing-hemolysin-like protein
MDPDPLPVLTSAVFTSDLLLLGFALLLVAALMGVRVALEHLRTTRIEELFSDRKKAHARLSVLMGDQERLYASATTLLAMSLIVYGFTAFAFLDALQRSLPVDSGWEIASFFVMTLTVLGLLFVSTVLLLFFTRIGSEWPERYMLSFAWLLIPLLRLLLPFSILSLKAKGAVSRMLGLPPHSKLPGVASLQELEEMVKASREAGALEGQETGLIEGALSLSDNCVSAIMTPRKDVVSLSIDATFEDVCRIVQEEGFSRYVVIGEDLDDVRGIFLIKDFVPILLERPSEPFSLQKYIRPALSIPGSKTLTHLLTLYRDNATHFAIVLDEHGGVDGLVTMEDLVEELLGDVYDEHDEPEEDIEVRETKAGDLLIDGSAAVYDLNEDFDLHLPEGDEYDTVAGWFIHELGKMPELGDEVAVNGYRVSVEELDQNRVTLLRLRRGAEMHS